MGRSLIEIAQELKDNNKNVQLIYAFNGTGKTRLSREFKNLISPKDEEAEENGLTCKKILYYNAFTEDLFYWDNDLENDTERKLIIRPNTFTNWIFEVQGQEGNVTDIFQQYADDKLTPHFNAQYVTKVDDRDVVVPAYSEVTFTYERGNEEKSDNVKISKGEESCFVWSIFYSLLKQVIQVLSINSDSIFEERDTDQFDELKYVFIDDPVSSLDDKHLIELAVNLAELINLNNSELNFIITTHNPLFFNVLSNHLKKAKLQKWILEKDHENAYLLKNQCDDSPFSYHIFLMKEIEEAIQAGQVRKYHFSNMRNILEKTSTFLGYDNWNQLLPKTEDGRTNAYENRLISLYNHSKQSGEEITELQDREKRFLEELLRYIKVNYKFK